MIDVEKLDYKNDYKFDSNIFNSETNVPSHPPGAGYLASPFVLLFSQLEKVIHNETFFIFVIFVFQLFIPCF